MIRLDVDKVSIGQQIRKAREARGMSQTALAALAGRTQADISNYERGLSEPQASSLWYISLALKAPISFFFSFDNLDREDNRS